MTQNRSTVLSWLYANVILFYPRVNITTISVGNVFPDVYPTPSTTSSLPSPTSTSPSLTSGIRKITVSTSSSFVTAISSAQFRDTPRPPFNFRNDFTTGVKYCNLFDVMVDAGYETVPVVVTEIGWPSASSTANEFEANAGYAEIYLRGHVKHLKYGMGTPLLREKVMNNLYRLTNRGHLIIYML
ncbi:hypothetical protein Fmac_012740 [Flemingia macrophylla]|uniref:glucan endo-1,3-beta-D-glucosidase n=1 Tax=Flemingia macrophylla TaxID=520843 RepID=A0ABD1MR59_9FABA